MMGDFLLCCLKAIDKRTHTMCSVCAAIKTIQSFERKVAYLAVTPKQQLQRIIKLYKAPTLLTVKTHTHTRTRISLDQKDFLSLGRNNSLLLLSLTRSVALSRLDSTLRGIVNNKFYTDSVCV